MSKIITSEKLFETVKKCQKEYPDLNFWEALYFVLTDIVEDKPTIEYNGKTYKIDTDFEAIQLLLDIHRDSILSKNKEP